MPAQRRRRTPARRRDGSLSEAAWQGQVIALARFYGWLIYHTHRSDRSAPGFPDLVLVRGVELIFAELKADAGDRRATVAQVAARDPWLQHRDVTEDQAEWLGALAQVGAAVALELDEVDRHFRHGDGTAPVDPPAIDVCLWRPRDFEQVQARLARGRTIIPASFAPSRPA